VAGKKPFIPLQITGKDGAATPEDLNRVQEQIRAAFAKLQQGGVTKVTSRDGSVLLNPSAGIGAVDLSVAFDTEQPGTTAITLANAPAKLASTTPALFRVVTLDGKKYVVPMWQLDETPPGPFPMTGLKLWVKGDAGVSTSGSRISSWADQSGNGNDLTPHISGGNQAPLYDATGFSAVPAAHFTQSDDSAMQNAAFAWSPSWSVLVVFQVNLTVTFGRLVDWYYPNDNIAINLVGPNFFDQWSGYNAAIALSTTYAYLTTYAAGGTAKTYVNSFASPVQTGSIAHTMNVGVNLGGLPGFGQGTETLVTEFAIWDHDLGSSELTSLGTYLHSRGYI
jgi:hypothetical protein